MNEKLKKNDYQLLFEENRKVYSKYYVFYYRPFDRMVVKAAVKKKVGNAVERNFYKRRLREILRRVAGECSDKNLLILGIIIRKPHFSFDEEFQFVEKNLKPIFC